MTVLEIRGCDMVRIDPRTGVTEVIDTLRDEDLSEMTDMLNRHELEVAGRLTGWGRMNTLLRDTGGNCYHAEVVGLDD
jgi:hypothetical protein